MKKIISVIVLSGLICALVCGCETKKEQNEIEQSIEEPQIIMEGELTTSYILPEGMTLESRIAVPEGFERTEAEEGSLAAFLRDYEMKEDGAPVLLHNGNQKSAQYHHVAVFDMDLVDGDLQQCADSVMRIWAEYFWETGQYDKIGFHFTSGDLCEYTQWRDGYRAVVSGNNVSFVKKASYDDSYENFENYLTTVFSYAGTLSMDTMESETIALEELQIGDVFLKGGSPGHVVMVVDMCENEAGDKAFLLAQGYMPAQEFHVIKNPAHKDDPWYYESEISFPFQTEEYTFDEESMVKRLKY